MCIVYFILYVVFLADSLAISFWSRALPSSALVLQRQISCHICDLLKSNFSRTTWETELQSVAGVELPNFRSPEVSVDQQSSSYLPPPRRFHWEQAHSAQPDQFSTMSTYSIQRQKVRKVEMNNHIWPDTDTKTKVLINHKTYQPWPSDWLKVVHAWRIVANLVNLLKVRSSN